MQVSKIKVSDLINYCRIDIEELDEKDIYLLNNDFEIFLKVAKEFIKNSTGLSDKDLDKYEDLTIVIYILVNDMYDTRTFTIDKTNLNIVVSTILGFHDNNLL